MKSSPSFDDIFAVMAAASVGKDAARVALPDDPDLDDTTTRFAIALNILLDDLAFRAQAKQRTVEELAATLDSIGDGVIATDASGLITRMNPVAERLTGAELSTATGKKLPEVFHIFNEDTREPVESPVDRVLREGVVVGLANHTILVSRNGTERAIADSAAPIRDGDGKLRGVVLVFRDQTEERNAQRAVKQGVDRLRWLSESSGQFAVATSNVERLLGVVARRVSELVGELCSIRLVSNDGQALEPNGAVGAVHHPDPELLEVARQFDVRQRVGEGISGKVLATGNPIRVPSVVPEDIVAQSPPKFRALVERLAITSLLVVPLKSRDRVLGVISLTRRDPANPYTLDDERLAQDLADRAALAIENALLFDALRKSEARKAAVMEAALDAIVLMDHEGKITEFNAAAERTFGYSRDEVVGKPLVEILIPPSLRDQHVAGLKRYLETGEPRVIGKRIEVPARRRDGAEFPAEVAVVRIRTEGDPVFTGYIRDITERRQAAEAGLLRGVKEAAEEANAELEAFSYSVAHDLRAPLRAINGFSAVLLADHAGALDDAGRGYLKRIASAAERMAALIDALLGLARLTRAEPRRERVDLNRLAHRVMEQLRGTEPGRAVEFVASGGLVAQADPQLVRALLENLLGNAWKFTSKTSRARIELGCEDVRGVTTYYVRDNGAGFDMNHADKLFVPFQRLHSSKDFEGTGIGLATVQRIVRRHGGRVWAEGTPNRGATFRFTLSAKT